MGLFIAKSWLIDVLLRFDNEKEQDFTRFGDEFIPFLAKNQFKSQLRKHVPMPKKDSTAEKLAALMNPTQVKLVKDFFRVQIHILPKNPTDFFYFP